MRVIGIDPGVTGALAVLERQGERGRAEGPAEGDLYRADIYQTDIVASPPTSCMYRADIALDLGPAARVPIGPGPEAPLGLGPEAPLGLGPWRVAAVYDLPVVSERTSTGRVRRHIDPVAMTSLLEQIGPVNRCVVERLVAPPGISGIAAYSLGATAATIATVLALAGIGAKLVSPGMWKRALEVPRDKNAARDYASMRFGTAEFWPRKLHHNRAEAALIALYGAML